MLIYGVMFKENGKLYNFKSDIEISLNTNVIVDTDKGEQFGKVVSFINELEQYDKEELRSIIRVATDSDYNKYLKNLKEATE